MHPRVKPALRRAWRDRQSVQFGVTSAHAVLVGPVDTATGTLLGLLDGTRGMPLLREEARARGLPEEQADRLVGRLAAAGLIDDVTAGGPGAVALLGRSAEFDRLRPDLASLSVVHPEPGGGARRLAARRAARVQVRGAGRVGTTLAAVLSAAGVGRVDVLDGGCVEPWDVAPGGAAAGAVGSRRDAVARRAVHDCAPGRAPRRRTDQDPDGEPVLSLVVVAPRDGLDAYVPDPAVAEPWVTSGIPHLYAGVVEATGVVGPLVLPGGTACAGCLTRTRAERDPGWPRMQAQWRSGRREGVPACDVALATAVAGLAAAHALALLDGELPSSAGARWEVALPLLDWRAEQLAAHPECPCGAGRRGEGDAPSGDLRGHDTMAP
ncbi:TOMM precursor leader peptide-binding protein [Streptomyces sp. NBC_00237]|uniref:TOMM precursor leader peptide-binding protein n=1 Tax=Streptomyces sp. NBC_00237 TaxID=2975687 RepID=UPI0022576A09|nr:TOMM precursor leader peptide-binding protein [Streptomyces sp. NBC_00237]MCX5204356.1 TOMM precursor leader peptide-binding protein [Streptomyces sp. NBC_00237]